MHLLNKDADVYFLRTEKMGAEIGGRNFTQDHGLAQRSSIKYSNWCHTNVIFFFNMLFSFQNFKKNKYIHGHIY